MRLPPFGEGSTFRLAPREGLDSGNRTGSKQTWGFDNFQSEIYFQVSEIDAPLAFQVQDKISIARLYLGDCAASSPVLERGHRFDSPPARDWTRGTEPGPKQPREFDNFQSEIYFRFSEIDAPLAFQVQNKMSIARVFEQIKRVPLPEPENRLFT